MLKISKESTYASKAESKVSKNISFEPKKKKLKKTIIAISSDPPCLDGNLDSQ